MIVRFLDETLSGYTIAAEKAKQACLNRPSKMEMEDGTLDGPTFTATVNVRHLKEGRSPIKERRWFKNDDQLFYANNRTYALSNQWAAAGMVKTLDAMVEAFPEYTFYYEMAD